jgi:membrane protease subunit (stomatin/prohibitin family)
MGLLSGKNSQLLKVIEWADDSQNTIVHKADFGVNKIFFGSKLFVRPSQVAIFVSNGKVCDVFEPGKYTLTPANIPFLTALLSLPYGFKSPIVCEVYFVNMKQFINQKWGTTNPVIMRDAEFGAVRLRAYGTYSFRVRVDSDASEKEKKDKKYDKHKGVKMFMTELFGSNSSFTTEDVNDFLRSHIISNLADSIAESRIAVLDMAMNLKEFAKTVKDGVTGEFEKIGLTTTAFNIENISLPENVEKAIDERAAVGAMGGLGMWKELKMTSATAEAMTTAAGNEGIGGFGASLGTGLAVADAMKSAMGGMLNNQGGNNASGQNNQGTTIVPLSVNAGNNTDMKFCTECGSKIPANAKFCHTCGAKQ